MHSWTLLTQAHTYTLNFPITTLTSTPSLTHVDPKFTLMCAHIQTCSFTPLFTPSPTLRHALRHPHLHSHLLTSKLIPSHILTDMFPHTLTNPHSVLHPKSYISHICRYVPTHLQSYYLPNSQMCSYILSLTPTLSHPNSHIGSHTYFTHTYMFLHILIPTFMGMFLHILTPKLTPSPHSQTCTHTHSLTHTHLHSYPHYHNQTHTITHIHIFTCRHVPTHHDTHTCHQAFEFDVHLILGLCGHVGGSELWR